MTRTPMRLGLTEDDRTATSRAYTRSNRDVWKTLGFRMLSTAVHDDDREVILAEMEVRRHQRLVMLAEDNNTSTKTLHTIAIRNMTKPPTKADRDALLEESKRSKARVEVQHFLEQCRHYLRKFVNLQNNYDPDAPYERQVRMEAKGVAFANLGAAYFRLASVRINQAESTSIFGLKDDSPQVGD